MQQNPNSLDRYSPVTISSGASATGGYMPPSAPLNDRGRGGLPRIIWRQRAIVVVCVALAIVLAVIQLVREPKLYTGTARLTVVPAGSRYSGETTDTSQLSNFLYTQREKLMSREILAGALGLPGIDDLRTFKEARHEGTTPLRLLGRDIDVTVGKKDDVLSVTFESPYPDDSATIANAIVDAYVRYQTQPHIRSNDPDPLEVYRQQKGNVEKDLAAKIAEMSALEQKYGILSAAEQDNISFKTLSMLSQQLTAAHAETLRARADYDEAIKSVRRDPRLVRQDNGTGIIALASAEDEQVLRNQLIQLQVTYQQMRTRYLPGHPAMEQMQRRIDQAAIAYADAIERRLHRAQLTEDDLKQQVQQQKQEAIQVSAKIAEYNRLVGDAERIRKVISNYDERIHAVELQRAAGAVDIDFFDRAEPPFKPSHPQKTRTLIIAIILGFFVGCGLALVRDVLDDRLRSSEEIKSALGMPLLGMVPAMPPGISPTVAAQKAVLDPNSEVAEAYRSVRTAIYFGAPKDRNKTILVTSPSLGDGKTTAAANLAAVIAQAGKKVLLIDADLRNPQIQAVFSLKENRVGLAGLLSGQGTLDKAIQPTQVDGLDILPCGMKPRNPSEMLNSPMFSELLEMLAEKYDQIVIDSPPVMGLADARIIAASCDLTVMVLRADRSTRKLAAMARDGLAGVGAHLLGVIVNDVSRRNENHYESGYSYNQGGRSGTENTALARQE